MRVLHLLNSRDYSGAESVVINIIKATRPDITSAYCSPNGSIESTLKKNAIDFLELKKFNYNHLKKVLEFYKPDIIHAHDFRASLLASLFSNKYKVISQIHQDPAWIKHINVKTLLFKFSARQFDKVIFVSKKTEEDFVFSKSIESKTQIIHNSVDLQDIVNLSAEKLNKDFDLIFVGRLVEDKNPNNFVDIVDQIKKKYSNIRAVMVGDGYLKAEVLKKINDLNLKNNIDLVGFSSNPYVYMKHSKICLITSRNEGFSLVAVEAASLGIPVVGYDIGGLTEVLKALGLIPVRNSKIMEENTIELLKNKDKYDFFGKREKKFAQKKFNLDTLGIKIEKLYGEIVNPGL